MEQPCIVRLCYPHSCRVGIATLLLEMEQHDGGIKLLVALQPVGTRIQNMTEGFSTVKHLCLEQLALST